MGVSGKMSEVSEIEILEQDMDSFSGDEDAEEKE